MSEAAAAELDRVPVASLVERYEIKSATVYDRLNGLKELGVATTRVGRSAYLEGENLRLMDELDRHLKAGGDVPSFIEQHKSQQDSGRMSAAIDALEESSQNSGSNSSSGAIELISVIRSAIPLFWQAGAQALTPLFASGKATNEKLDSVNESLSAIVQQQAAPALPPMYHMEMLSKAVQEGWELPTSELAELLKIAPSSLAGKKEFVRRGFRFERVGRIGRESAWKVSKAIESTADATEASEQS